MHTRYLTVGETEIKECAEHGNLGFSVIIRTGWRLIVWLPCYVHEAWPPSLHLSFIQINPMCVLVWVCVCERACCVSECVCMRTFVCGCVCVCPTGVYLGVVCLTDSASIQRQWSIFRLPHDMATLILYVCGCGPSLLGPVFYFFMLILHWSMFTKKENLRNKGKSCFSFAFHAPYVSSITSKVRCGL